MSNATILSTGSYLPDCVVLNEELTQFPETSIPRIAQKTGVLSRRRAAEEQCTSDLGALAARTCLEKAGFPIDRVEGIIVSTSSPDRVQPPTATRIQAQLGADDAFAFDMNSVCSGSTYGICLANSMIKSGQYKTILLVAAEMYSRILNKKDFSTYPYFGDGAGAILFGADGDSQRGVLYSRLKSDGSKCEVVGVPGGGTMLPFEKMTDPTLACLKMNGRAVLEFACDKGAEVIQELLDDMGVSIDEIKCILPHQANINIIRAIAERIGAPREKFFVNLDRYGNTASASVLIALDEAISAGVVSRGDLVITVAFGGGLSWGANLIRI
jgi:3-oxoacyl-[acyl-carrier-protein] synthase-3